MRILVTADPELPVPPRLYGGIERIVDLLVRGLSQRGHTVALAAHAESSVPVDRLFPWPGKRSQEWKDACRNTWALGAAVRAFEPDLVHSFSRLLYLLPVLRRRIPKIMTFERIPTARTVRQAARLAKGTLTFTGCSESICREGRLAAGKWVPVHNGVDLKRYTFQPSVSPDAPLLFFSRIERLKGAHTAIAAAKKAGRRLVLAGNHGESGEEKAYWEKEIAPHLGKDGIDYVGPLDDDQKNVWLGKAAALVVPIEWEEPFGIVFAEALACGTPVISCPRGALPEIVRHGTDGFLVGSVEEAAAAIGRIGAIQRSVCRARAEACFSADTMVENYLRVYQGKPL
jgi:glycosyltransferase involved in cell wall biosynthesis